MHHPYCLCPDCVRAISLADDETREQARAAIAVCALQDRNRPSEPLRPGVRRRPARQHV